MVYDTNIDISMEGNIMPKNNNKLFEDFTKLAGSAMDTAMHSMADAKAQFDALVGQKLDARTQ